MSEERLNQLEKEVASLKEHLKKRELAALGTMGGVADFLGFFWKERG
jgi:hypothetical protein